MLEQVAFEALEQEGGAPWGTWADRAAFPRVWKHSAVFFLDGRRTESESGLKARKQPV